MRGVKISKRMGAHGFHPSVYPLKLAGAMAPANGQHIAGPIPSLPAILTLACVCPNEVGISSSPAGPLSLPPATGAG